MYNSNPNFRDIHFGVCGLLGVETLACVCRVCGRREREREPLTAMFLYQYVNIAGHMGVAMCILVHRNSTLALRVSYYVSLF